MPTIQMNGLVVTMAYISPRIYLSVANHATPGHTACCGIGIDEPVVLGLSDAGQNSCVSAKRSPSEPALIRRRSIGRPFDLLAILGSTRPRVASTLAWIYNTLGISSMQVSKWGNSLAVRLPAVVVEALDLKEGDEIEISIAGKRNFKVGRDRSKDRAFEQLRQMKWSFPPDFKFNREEIK